MKQRGNILFLILLAVVLFAALSYAVTSSMRGGGKDAGSENVKLTVSQIINQTTLIRAMVNRLILINGCTANDIHFYANGIHSYWVGPVGKEKCGVFRSTGGGVSFASVPSEAIDQSTTINNGSSLSELTSRDYFFPSGVILQNVGTSSPEMIMVVPAVNREICIEFNQAVGVVNPSDNPPVISGLIQGVQHTGNIDGVVSTIYQAVSTNSPESFCANLTHGSSINPTGYSIVVALIER